MRKVIKFTLALIILFIFAGIVAILSQFVEIPMFSSQTDNWIRTFPWLLPILKGIIVGLIFAFFCAFLLVLATSGKRTAIVFKEKDRKIKVTKNTIESIICKAVDEIIPSDKRKLKIKIKRKNRVMVRMKLMVRNKSKEQLLADELKRKIEFSLEDALQTVNHQVHIQLVEVDSEIKTFGKKKSRVV